MILAGYLNSNLLYQRYSSSQEIEHDFYRSCKKPYYTKFITLRKEPMYLNYFNIFRYTL